MSTVNATEIAEEDHWRVITYRMLARILASAPDSSVLQILQSVEIKSTDTAITQAWSKLAQIARHTKLKHIENEYNRLFIGFTNGEVVPYASRYLTGYLMEKPLAKLRQDLIQHGIQRQHSVFEPEDHIAALLEAMSLLIESSDNFQWAFLNRHLLTWAQQFFIDLQKADSAKFYHPVGLLGHAFMELESTHFSIQNTHQ